MDDSQPSDICHRRPIEPAKAIVTHSFRVMVFPPQTVPFRLAVDMCGGSGPESNYCYVSCRKLRGKRGALGHDQSREKD